MSLSCSSCTLLVALTGPLPGLPVLGLGSPFSKVILVVLWLWTNKEVMGQSHLQICQPWGQWSGPLTGPVSYLPQIQITESGCQMCLYFIVNRALIDVFLLGLSKLPSLNCIEGWEDRNSGDSKCQGFGLSYPLRSKPRFAEIIGLSVRKGFLCLRCQQKNKKNWG